MFQECGINKRTQKMTSLSIPLLCSFQRLVLGAACELLSIRDMVKVTIWRSKGKCKATSIQARTGPEGSRRLKIPDFKTVGT